MTLVAHLVQALRPARPPGARCASCRHFCNEPFHLERAMPGFSALSSALGSVLADDGHCGLHQRHVVALGGCADFRARKIPLGGPETQG